MILVLLAEDYGARLWPVTSEHYPCAVLDILRGRTLLEESFGRMPVIHIDVNNIFVVATVTGAAAIEKSSIFQTYKIPSKNLIRIISDLGSLTSISFATKYITEMRPELPGDEVIIFSPVDQFFYPPELFAFHFNNLISYVKLNPNKLVCLSTPPGGPSSHIDHVKIAWDKLNPVGEALKFEQSDNYAAYEGDDYEEEVDTTSTLIADITEFKVRSDINTSVKLMEDNWIWELQTYLSTLKTVKEFTSNYEISDKKVLLGGVIDQMFDSKWWYWMQRLQPSKYEELWNLLPRGPLNRLLLPKLIENGTAVAGLIGGITWCALRDWVSVKQLLYDTDIFDNIQTEKLHLINSDRNLVFKPPSKEVTLVGVENLIVVDSGDKLLIGTPEGLYGTF